MEWLPYFFLGSMLMGESIIDVIKRKIPLWFLVVFGILSLIIVIFCQKGFRLEMLWGAVIGALVAVFGKLTKEAIGYGDALTLIITGVVLGGRNNLILLFISVFLAAVFSVVLLLCKKVKKKSSFPFIPFLFGGYLLLCFGFFMR